MDENSEQLDFDFSVDDLLEFPRNLGEQGLHQFHSEQRRAILALEEKFGVALNKRVCLRLHGWSEEFEGKLMLDTLLPPRSRKEGLRLRLGKIAFDHTDIEFCRTLD